MHVAIDFDDAARHLLVRLLCELKIHDVQLETSLSTACDNLLESFILEQLAQAFSKDLPGLSGVIKQLTVVEDLVSKLHRLAADDIPLSAVVEAVDNARDIGMVRNLLEDVRGILNDAGNEFTMWSFDRRGSLALIINNGDFRIEEWYRDHMKDGVYVG